VSIGLMGSVVAATGPWYSSSLTLAAVSVAWLLLAYFVYGRHIARKLVGPTDAPTPAHAQRDDVDFQPAKPIVLFGHHFASIAGAGPILGPVVAVAFFGWGPTALWILLGVVLIGAVHDYMALMISVRNRGASLPDVAKMAVSGPARVLFLIFVWIGLVLVITAFCNAALGTFIDAPEIVLPTFSLMLIAVLFGFMNYRVKLNTGINTVIALVLLFIVMCAGFWLKIDLQKLGLSADAARYVWLGVLIAYGVVASVLPVWVLLQPRDYIATWILVFGMVLGFAGIFVVAPSLKAPAFPTAMAKPGPIWPALFILVACGAVSGFHCLVAGGTTSKQLAREGHGLPVGFGSMLTEGALAIMALVAVGAGLAFGALGTSAPGDGTLHGFLAKGGGGPIAAFGRGFGVLTRPFLKPIGDWIGVERLGMIVGTTIVNAFVMTTLDTTVRLSRFITAELVGPHVKVFRNRLVASLAAVVPAFLLAMNKGAFDRIWQLFGASNQLIAALALLVITAYLLKRGKPTLYTLIPAVFMLVTTMAALGWQAYGHLVAAEVGKKDYVLGIAALVLLGLALALAIMALTVKRELPPAQGRGPAPESGEGGGDSGAQACGASPQELTR